eukprot:XP_028357031.1 uncharacterized protein LOC114483883 isoform X2 [Physeter catodon]
MVEFQASVTDLLSEEPRTGLRPLRHAKSGKSMSQSLWLNNNVLNDLRDFNHVVSQLLEHPENLAWIDLSFNDLTSIDPVSPEGGPEATLSSPQPLHLPHIIKEVVRQHGALQSTWLWAQTDIGSNTRFASDFVTLGKLLTFQNLSLAV